MKILIPGSFDPPTNGHIDVIKRCSKIFTEILVGVVVNPSKESLFSREERSSIKGLRAMTDFDYEFQMAQANSTLAGFETIFIPSSPEFGYLSSSMVKEIHSFGGDVSSLVPSEVLKRLNNE